MNIRLRRLIFVVLCASVLGTAGIAATRAQETASVDMSAFIGVEPVLTITVCDDSAYFGTGIEWDGFIPQDADATVSISGLGTFSDGEGVFYTWEPSCQADDATPGLTLSGNVDFHYNVCGTENDAVDASPDVTLAAQDLKFITSPLPLFSQLAYDTWAVQKSMPTCPTKSSNENSGDPAFIIGLRVDVDDATGGFHTVLTFSVEPS